MKVTKPISIDYDLAKWAEATIDNFSEFVNTKLKEEKQGRLKKVHRVDEMPKEEAL